MKDNFFKYAFRDRGEQRFAQRNASLLLAKDSSLSSLQSLRSLRLIAKIIFFIFSKSTDHRIAIPSFLGVKNEVLLTKNILLQSKSN